MKCEYCGTDKQSGIRCEKCGAELPKKENLWKSDPFFYNGYILYCLSNYAAHTREVQFWLGRELIQRIEVGIDALNCFVGEGEDPLPFFWKLFLLAENNIDVVEWREKNEKHPAQFVITRRENEELTRQKGLSLRDIALEASRVIR